MVYEISRVTEAQFRNMKKNSLEMLADLQAAFLGLGFSAADSDSFNLAYDGRTRKLTVMDYGRPVQAPNPFAPIVVKVAMKYLKNAQASK
ncbi:hypothetical protein HYV80_06475 [Candidatus Woesearchaeota archaeon]|nr:hypothetical protein [Candidatus Woesearchaeota archaeon]